MFLNFSEVSVLIQKAEQYVFLPEMLIKTV